MKGNEATHGFSFWRNVAKKGTGDWLTAIRRIKTDFARSRSEEWKTAISAWSVPEHRVIEGAATELSLSGVPFVVKNLYDQAGTITEAGSILLRKVGMPATEDAAVISHFRSVGMVPVGRTHMNEFAYGLDGKNLHFGNCGNPMDPRRISGGSSSGSAWAVGSGVVPFALGTDTGGSVRVPAAFCGIWGFRCGVNGWAREGVFPLAPTFDTVGWFTGNPRDMQTVLESLPWERESVRETGRKDAGRRQGETLRLIWFSPEEVPISGTAMKRYRDFISRFDVSENPEETKDLQLLSDRALEAYNVIGSTDAYEIHKAWLDEYRDFYSPVVWSLIDRARHWEEGALESARSTSRSVKEAVYRLLEDYDAIIMPAVHSTAPFIEEVSREDRTNILRLTCFASHATTPVLTIPLATEDDLSVGVQVIMKEGVAAEVLRIIAGNNGI